MKKNKSTTFKYNNIDDSKIFDSLENKVIDKSQFIKNALYYYIVMIEKGVIVDRNLPQDLNSISDNVNQLLNFISQNNLENTYEFKGSIKEIYTNEEKIAINTGAEVHFIGLNGWLIKKYDSYNEVNNVILGNSIAGIVYKDKIRIVEI